MPTRTYNRIWCKTCNEFELHYQDFFNKKEYLECNVCGTHYTDIMLRDIPEEKRKVQRERYNKSKGTIDTYLQMILGMGTGMGNMFGESRYNDTIVESDAGQKSIDKQRQIEREKIREVRRVQRESDLKLREKYNGLRRNDKCICGSGKKYKKCCWNTINEIR